MDDQVSALGASMRAGYLDVETYRKAVNQLQTAMDNAKLDAEMKTFTKETADANKKWKTFANDVSGGLTDVIMGTRSWRQELQSLTADLVKAILKATILKGVQGVSGSGSSSTGSSSIGSSGGVGGILKSLMGTLLAGGEGLASGGPVESYSPYVVGEKGPELFVPDVGGKIIPHGQSGGGGGGGGVINIDARGADASVEHRVMAAMQAYYKQSAVNGYLTMYEMSRRS
jgi:phage-related minor tail protein